MGQLPERLLLHQLTAFVPATVVDDYGNEVDDFDAGGSFTIVGRIQQDTRSELFPDGRHPTEAQWLLLTNDPLTGVKRIAWVPYPPKVWHRETPGKPDEYPKDREWHTDRYYPEPLGMIPKEPTARLCCGWHFRNPALL
jgi:hypothetical protein